MGNLGDAAAEVLEPPDRSPTHEWALKNCELFPPITRLGFFDVSTSRHFIEPLEALDDERTREVNVLKPVRGGGSLLGDVHLVSVMSRKPGPYLSVFQTDPDAKMHFHDRLKKVLTQNKCTASLLPDKYEWSEIQLSNGFTLYVGGPTLANLQSKGVRYLRLDECWMYPDGRMNEAEARVGDFLKMEMSKILRISQGGPRPGLSLDDDSWFRAYSKSAIREWEASCSHCGKYYDPVFSGQREDGSFWGITWDKHMLPNGDWDIGKCTPTVRFECPHCMAPVLDIPKTKSEWNRTGRYRLASEENRKRKSFHWETVIDYPWDELVELWLDACNAEKRGDLKPKLQFYQKRRAMFKDEESLLKGGLNLRRTVYDINTKWAEEEARFLSIDRQEEDTYWWMVRAWSKEKSRRLGFGKCYGFAELEEIRERFKVERNKTFMDSAFEPKGDHGVYAACVKYGWIAVRGAAEQSFAHRMKGGRIVHKSYAPLTWGDPGGGSGSQGRKYCYLIRFSKPQLNSKVQELIDHGHWEEPLLDMGKDAGDTFDLEKEYNAQMASRIKKTEYDPKRGVTKVFWKEGKNDHARDLANQSVLGAILAEKLPDPAAERLTKTEEKVLNE